MALYFLINSLGGGGAERVVTRLSYKLNPKKIFLLEDRVQYSPPVEVEKLSTFTPADSPILKTLYIPIYVKKLKKYLEKGDVVVSFLERANFVNTLLGREYKRIISIRTSIGARKSYHPYRFLIKKLYPLADFIVVPNHMLGYDLKNFVNLREEQVKVIYNPLDIDEIKSKSREGLEVYKFLKDYPYLINVGRLTEAKGQWYLLRIFRELKRKQKELKLILLGEGELKNYLVELSENLGLKTYVWDRDKLHKGYDVYFLGFQKNPYKFVKQAKAFVFSSLWEGFPNVVAESLAVGKAVISTDCRTGPREILAPDTDFLKETKEPEFAKYGVLMPTFERRKLKANEKLAKEEKIWIDTLKGLLEEEKMLKEYEQKAPERAFDFHIDKIAKQWIEVIEQS